MRSILRWAASDSTLLVVIPPDRVSASEGPSAFAPFCRRLKARFGPDAGLLAVPAAKPRPPTLPARCPTLAPSKATCAAVADGVADVAGAFCALANALAALVTPPDCAGVRA